MPTTISPTAPAVRRRTAPLIAVLALALIAAIFGGGSPATAATVRPALTASAAVDLYEGYLNAGATARYCFDFANHSQVGPVAVNGTARDYGVIITTVSTDLEYRLNVGWVYCATLKNISAIGSGVDLSARGNLAGTDDAAAAAALNPGASTRLCFNYASHSLTGPVVATAVPNAVGVILTTTSVDLENRLNYGWVYCATIRNASAAASTFTLHARSALTSTSYFDTTVGYLAGGATGRYCYNALPTSVPTAAIGAASTYNTVLTTVSTDRENRLNYGLVYCATIRNASTTGTNVRLIARTGL